MELGALYEKAVTQHIGIKAYVAPSGEPALVFVAFMHRPSAMDNPLAPLGHRWDATHIAFGVVTAGLFTHDWKLEGSAFNGREPDENRWDFDPIKLDSYSGRVLYNPSAHWALSAGYGFLKSPEALVPMESMHRITASAIYGSTIGAEGQLAATVVWGANKPSTNPDLSQAVLLEAEAILDKSNTLVGRGKSLPQKKAATISSWVRRRVGFHRSAVRNVSLFIRPTSENRGLAWWRSRLARWEALERSRQRLEGACGLASQLAGRIVAQCVRPVPRGCQVRHGWNAHGSRGQCCTFSGAAPVDIISAAISTCHGCSTPPNLEHPPYDRLHLVAPQRRGWRHRTGGDLPRVAKPRGHGGHWRPHKESQRDFRLLRRRRRRWQVPRCVGSRRQCRCARAPVR